MKRIAALVCLFFLFPLAPAARASEAFAVAAKGAVLIEAGTGRILYAQNADTPYPMDSTTKLMTCLLALENASLDEPVTAGKNAHGVPGTSIYLSEGETLTMEQMLYGLMLRSGNDAAVAIAEHVAGSVPAFAERMNARAKQLDANAHYVNPHGLDADGHQASALALARIMRECLKNPSFRAITGTQRKVIPWVGNEYSRVLENKNKLLRTYAGATGGKTGYTGKAGRCLVFSAERDGMELIGAVLNCPTWFDTAAALLDHGFDSYRLATPLQEGQIAAEARVTGGNRPSVPVRAAATLAAPVRDGERCTVCFDFGEGIAAPVRTGAVVGRAILEVDGEALAACELLAAADVGRFSLREALKQALRRWALQFTDI